MGWGASCCAQACGPGNLSAYRRAAVRQGVGLVWNTTLGRLEVNLCRVLARRPTDVARQGVEVGFAPQFN